MASRSRQAQTALIVGARLCTGGDSGEDGHYVLQMNADALHGQEGILMDATIVIDEKTAITP
jgi:Probable lipoprotein LpqN